MQLAERISGYIGAVEQWLRVRDLQEVIDPDDDDKRNWCADRMRRSAGEVSAKADELATAMEAIGHDATQVLVAESMITQRGCDLELAMWATTKAELKRLAIVEDAGDEGRVSIQTQRFDFERNWKATHPQFNTRKQSDVAEFVSAYNEQFPSDAQDSMRAFRNARQSRKTSKR